MAQMRPRYPFMTSSVNEIFVDPLVERYGDDNVVWPIVLIKEDQIDSYLYERSEHCSINNANDNRPNSNSGKTSYYLDYTVNPRNLVPNSNDLAELCAEEHSCSYDCIVNSETLSSVDLDYVWCNNDQWRAIELTTLWMPLRDRAEAERLVGMFTRRPSWNGHRGPHGIRKLIDASNDLNLEYWMVCVNSIKGVSNDLVRDGNAFRFPLTHENIDRIINGEPPLGSVFSTFDELIDWL